MAYQDGAGAGGGTGLFGMLFTVTSWVSDGRERRLFFCYKNKISDIPIYFVLIKFHNYSDRIIVYFCTN